jgi:hypothetical protein
MMDTQRLIGCAEKAKLSKSGYASLENVANNASVDADPSSIHGSAISFHDIHYSVQVKNPEKTNGKMTKEILRGIR